MGRDSTTASCRRAFYASDCSLPGSGARDGEEGFGFGATAEVSPQANALEAGSVQRPRIAGLLEEFPRLSGVRVHEILTEEGFEGSVSLVRAYLREVRPRPVEAYQRAEYRPGAIGQVDWAKIPDAIPDPLGVLQRPWALIITLGYSRMLTLAFSFRTRMVDFLRCHVQALEFFGGTPHTLVYDNLKSVVVKRRGSETIFNAEFLAFADH